MKPPRFVSMTEDEVWRRITNPLTTALIDLLTREELAGSHAGCYDLYGAIQRAIEAEHRAAIAAAAAECRTLHEPSRQAEARLSRDCPPDCYACWAGGGQHERT